MSLTLAQRDAGELRTALLDHGVRRVSLELQPGVAGSGWHCSTFKRGLGHHIASRPSQGQTPGLALVKRGRPDLGGPLCNGYGGYDLTARIITMGWANHPGAGGPWSVPGWGTVPRDNGRPYIFGWEFEGGYEPYTDEMHDFMARCGAGTLDWLGNAPVECWDEHKGWAGSRKPDRVGYTTATGRARITNIRDERDWLDMASEADVQRIVHDTLLHLLRSEGVAGAGDAAVMADRYKQAGVDVATKDDIAWDRRMLAGWLGAHGVDDERPSEVLETVRAIAAPDTDQPAT